MFRVIGELLTTMLMEWRWFLEENVVWQDPKVKLENQLRIMYGRGEISASRFVELVARLRRDQIGKGEIILEQRDAQRRLEVQGRYDYGFHDPEITRSLNRLYLDRGLMEESRAAIQRNLEALAQEARSVQEQAEIARRNAQLALPDEAQARTHLDTWQSLLELSRILEGRTQSVERELHRLEDLESELRASITSLKLLDSQVSLAALNMRVRQDLFVQGQRR